MAVYIQVYVRGRGISLIQFSKAKPDSKQSPKDCFISLHIIDHEPGSLLLKQLQPSGAKKHRVPILIYWGHIKSYKSPPFRFRDVQSWLYEFFAQSRVRVLRLVAGTSSSFSRGHEFFVYLRVAQSLNFPNLTDVSNYSDGVINRF